MYSWLRSRRARVIVAWSTCLSFVLTPAASAGDRTWQLIQWKTSAHTPVEELAERIDHMERSLDEYGSIVIKTPDVWGESRLMRHRSDVENQLKARLGSFDFRINAVQATRDAAFLATAFAIGSEVGNSGAPANNSANSAASLIGNPNDATAGQTLVPRREFLNAFANTEGTTANKTLSINIEPVIELDQLNRYLQHLNELRRLNEGDDNADTPGYALNLIRVPVSVLPGRKTEEGFGAEVQITVDPYISDEVLPLAFKDFVINGVVDRIAIETVELAQRAPISQLEEILNDWYSGKIPNTSTASVQHAPASAASGKQPRMTLTPVSQSDGLREVDTAPNPLKMERLIESKRLESAEFRNQLPEGYRELAPGDIEPAAKIVDETMTRIQQSNGGNDDDGEIVRAIEALRGMRANRLADQVTRINNSKDRADAGKVQAEAEIVLGMVERLAKIYSTINPSANINHIDLSISPSLYQQVDGHSLFVVALHCYRRLVANESVDEVPDVSPSHRMEHGLTLPAVESLLRSELETAYEFLTQESTSQLWDTFCTPQLATEIREIRGTVPSAQVDELIRSHLQSNPTAQSDLLGGRGIYKVREAFFDAVANSVPNAKASVTASLAWQIIVESALVNAQLQKDMRETAALKNCPCVTGECMQFYGPNPAPESRAAFREYVRCKWPIHVFSLDPVTQDQNIADSFSERREMQMALAIASANQGLRGQALSRFVRRLEYDLQTIELNRTAIGFSHGDNTFGWRFYPRVQAPQVPSNLQATFGDLLIGQQDRDSRVRHYKLEPGIRECTALVVMPSFVPQVTVDVRSNFFRLTGHKHIHEFMHRKPGYESTVELSRELTDLRSLQQQCIKDAHRYRDGEVFRLCKAVERLDDRLSMQTHQISVPWENSLGGFEVFQSGTRVLNPELHGWYGAPGVLVITEGERRNVFARVEQAERALAQAQMDYRLIKGTPNNSESPWKEAKEKVDQAIVVLDNARGVLATYRNHINETAVFLAGKNFSVLNCRVIAGGVDITDSIKVINRNLMQVLIPSTASTIATAHSPTRRHVVVHLATPHGATSRLLIPAYGSADMSDDSEGIKKLKDEIKDLIQTSENKSIANSDSDEDFHLRWGQESLSGHIPVQVYADDKALHVRKFCPPDSAKMPLKIVKATNGTIWPKDGMPDEPEIDLPVSCELAVSITTFSHIEGHLAETSKLSVGPWQIKDGDFKDEKIVTPLTAGELLTRILKKAGGRIPCNTDQITVEGFVRFRSGGRVSMVHEPIMFSLEHISPPDQN
jgi:hypothetical protein